jgi:hypothetical protein
MAAMSDRILAPSGRGIGTEMSRGVPAIRTFIGG